MSQLITRLGTGFTCVELICPENLSQDQRENLNLSRHLRRLGKDFESDELRLYSSAYLGEIAVSENPFRGESEKKDTAKRLELHYSIFSSIVDQAREVAEENSAPYFSILIARRRGLPEFSYNPIGGVKKTIIHPLDMKRPISSIDPILTLLPTVNLYVRR